MASCVASVVVVGVLATGCGAGADGRATEADGAAGHGLTGPKNGGQAALADGRQKGPPVKAARRMAQRGVVTWFNDAKGYGFISREMGADVFVHHSSIIAEGFRTLSVGDVVTFDVVEGPKGLQAKNVVKIG